MQPTAQGTHRVAEHVREMWADPNRKKEVLKMFQNCQYDPDQVMKPWFFFECRDLENSL